jgi:hypothetical protein
LSALVGFRLVFFYHQAGGGVSNQCGRGKMKVQAVPLLNIKVSPSTSLPQFPSQRSFVNSNTFLVALFSFNLVIVVSSSLIVLQCL